MAHKVILRDDNCEVIIVDDSELSNSQAIATEAIQLYHRLRTSQAAMEGAEIGDIVDDMCAVIEEEVDTDAD